MNTQLTNLYIVTAPSGTGKTTMTRRLIKETSDLEFSVSFTTRKKRPQENDGEHYRFINKQEFMKKIKEGSMLEYAEVHGNLYGTAEEEVYRIINKKNRALLEIDVQGAKNILAQTPSAALLFLLPPSIKSLQERLGIRGTDSKEICKIRLMTAKEELKIGRQFTNFIINDDFETAYNELNNYVNNNQQVKISAKEGQKFCEKLIKEFKYLF